MHNSVLIIASESDSLWTINKHTYMLSLMSITFVKMKYSLIKFNNLLIFYKNFSIKLGITTYCNFFYFCPSMVALRVEI